MTSICFLAGRSGRQVFGPSSGSAQRHWRPAPWFPHCRCTQSGIGHERHSASIPRAPQRLHPSPDEPMRLSCPIGGEQASWPSCDRPFAAPALMPKCRDDGPALRESRNRDAQTCVVAPAAFLLGLVTPTRIEGSTWEPRLPPVRATSGGATGKETRAASSHTMDDPGRELRRVPLSFSHLPRGLRSGLEKGMPFAL